MVYSHIDFGRSKDRYYLEFSEPSKVTIAVFRYKIREAGSFLDDPAKCGKKV